jgi:hypothetical protein
MKLHRNYSSVIGTKIQLCGTFGRKYVYIGAQFLLISAFSLYISNKVIISAKHSSN